MNKNTLFWDVDTQYDFMRPEGRLYVPGAEGIIDIVNQARRFALQNGYSIIASTDWHNPDNREISEKPDFKKTFPMHAMADSTGSERVGWLGDINIEEIPNRKIETAELQKIFDKNQFHVVLRKEELNPFSNPNVKEMLAIIKPEAAVVFGVPLDLCVRQAVEGLLEMNVKTYLLRDAAKGLGVKKKQDVLAELSNKGAEIIATGDLAKKLQ